MEHFVTKQGKKKGNQNILTSKLTEVFSKEDNKRNQN